MTPVQRRRLQIAAGLSGTLLLAGIWWLSGSSTAQLLFWFALWCAFVLCELYRDTE